MFLKHFVRDLQLVTKEHPTARSVVYSYSDVDTRCLVNPGGPPPPSPRLSSPVLSLSPSCHLHSPAHCNPLLHQLLSESPAFIPPPWNMAAVSGEIDTTAYLYCCSLSLSLCHPRVTRKLSHDHSNSDLYGASSRWHLDSSIMHWKLENISRSCSWDIPSVFFHVL